MWLLWALSLLKCVDIINHQTAIVSRCLSVGLLGEFLVFPYFFCGDGGRVEKEMTDSFHLQHVLINLSSFLQHHKDNQREGKLQLTLRWWPLAWVIDKKVTHFEFATDHGKENKALTENEESKASWKLSCTCASATRSVWNSIKTSLCRLLQTQVPITSADCSTVKRGPLRDGRRSGADEGLGSRLLCRWTSGRGLPYRSHVTVTADDQKRNLK